MGQQTLNFLPLEKSFQLENGVKSSHLRVILCDTNSFWSYNKRCSLNFLSFFFCIYIHTPTPQRSLHLSYPFQLWTVPYLQWTVSRNSENFFKVYPASGPSGMKQLRLCYCEFPSELPFAFPTFRFSLVPEHRWPVRVGDKGGGARESAHGLRRHRLFLAQPEPPRPQSPGLFLQPRTRPTLASPGQGSAQVRATSQVGPAPGRPGPPVRSSPWTPASGDGRGPRRPPPRQLRLGRRECAPPATPASDLPAGERGAPGQRPRARGRAPRRPEAVPGTPSIPGGAGRAETPGDCRGPARPVAGVAGTWLSP